MKWLACKCQFKLTIPIEIKIERENIDNHKIRRNKQKTDKNWQNLLKFTNFSKKFSTKINQTETPPQLDQLVATTQLTDCNEKIKENKND